MSTIRIVFSNEYAPLRSVRDSEIATGIVQVLRPHIVLPDGRASRPNPHGGPWLTLDEAGKIVGLAHRTMFGHVQSGRIASQRFWAGAHRWWMIHVRDLERFMAGRGAVRRAA